MAIRSVFETKTSLPTGPARVRIINNPTIEDVLASETRTWLYSFSEGNVDDTRRVSYDIRNYLIRQGVER